MDRLGRWLGRGRPPGGEAAGSGDPGSPPAQALPPGEEPSGSSGPEPAPSGPASGLSVRGVWEATRRLALTPVDPWFEKVAQGLDRTRRSLVGQVSGLFSRHGRIDEELWEELEGVLLSSDVGVPACERILAGLRAAVKDKRLSQSSDLLVELRSILGELLEAGGGQARQLSVQPGRLNVILMVGVNGAGKTTSTAKLAHRYRQAGLKVLLAAADTFRAAAIDQLQVWADRVGVDLIRHQEGSDPAAVVYDALVAARARGVDLLLIDTAGRLHSKAPLMEELKKIRRVAARELEGCPHEVLLVLDATTGQNALAQARVFHQATALTGLVLCKLDGTARGGILLAISQELGLPVKLIGVGEGLEDLQEFCPEVFLDALFGDLGAGREGQGEEPGA